MNTHLGSGGVEVLCGFNGILAVEWKMAHFNDESSLNLVYLVYLHKLVRAFCFHRVFLFFYFRTFSSYFSYPQKTLPSRVHHTKPINKVYNIISFLCNGLFQ